MYSAERYLRLFNRIIIQSGTSVLFVSSVFIPIFPKGRDIIRATPIKDVAPDFIVLISLSFVILLS